MLEGSKVEGCNGLAELRSRVAQGLMTKASRWPAIVDKSPAAFYACIDRGEIEAVTLGRSKLIPPHEGRRLLGMAAA